MGKASDDARVTGDRADRPESGGLGMTGSTGPASVGDGADRTTVDSAARRSRMAAEASADSVPEAAVERASQTRARDGEAPRASHTLAEAQDPQQSGVRVEMPTRRQLRLQQAQGRAVLPRPLTEGLVAVTPTDSASMADRPGATAAGAAPTPVPGGRRDRRRRSDRPADGTPDTPAGVSGGASDRAVDDAVDGRRTEELSVEEALAARHAIAEEARELVAGLRTAGTDDPFIVDAGLLAQQKALAERAALLNSRARATEERPSRPNEQPTVPVNDPTTAHNLSIVAPPEFVQVPGGSQAVLRAPATSSVPVVFLHPAPSSPTPSAEGAEGGGVGTPARVDPDETEPVGARSAFGLDPLDAMTAGLGRLRRIRIIQYSLLGAGAAALSTGIVLTVSSLNG